MGHYVSQIYYSEKITFRASEKLKNELEKYAQLQGISTGKLIRNWINVILENQVLKSSKHIYQIEDGRQFQNMKELCIDLKISSRTARKRIKNCVIKKIDTNPFQTQKYGEEISATKSRPTR